MLPTYPWDDQGHADKETNSDRFPTKWLPLAVEGCDGDSSLGYYPNEKTD